MHHLIFNSPAPIFFLVFASVLLVVPKRSPASTEWSKRLSLIAGAATVALYFAVQGINLLRGGLLWHDEANILSIAAAYTRGQAMYHSRFAADYYSLFYGPVTYLVYAPFLAVFSNPLLEIRVALLIVSLIEVVLLYRIARVWLDRAESVGILCVALAILLAYPDPLLGFRGDVWLLLFITIATLISVRTLERHVVFWSVVVGLCAGTSIDIKATVIPVLCLVIEVLHRRSGARAAFIAAVTCVFTCSAIFLLPHLSFANYVSWLLLSSHQRFLKSTCFANLLVLAMMLAPYMAAKFIWPWKADEWRKKKSLYLLGAAAVATGVLTGSKNGAGPWHLWPVMPVLLMGAAYELRNRRPESLAAPVSSSTVPRFSKQKSMLAVALAVAGLVTAIRFVVLDVQILKPLLASNWKFQETVARESLLQIAEVPHRKNISMGYGDNMNDARTNLRFELPLKGQEYFFDENEVVEGAKERQPFPQNVLTRILGCDDDWLIPHGEEPFSVRVGILLPFNPTPYVFPDALRLGFVQTHTLTQTGNVYDRWSCKADVAKP